MKTYRSVVGDDQFGARSEEISISGVFPFDEVLDREYWAWSPSNVVWHFTRTPWDLEVPQVGVGMATNVSEGGMISSAVKAVAYPVPAVIAYGCTSGSFVNGVSGEERLRESMKQGGIKRAVTASGAIVEALRSLGANRPAIVTPYNEETTLRLVSFLDEAGFDVAAVGFMGLEARIEDVEYAATKAAIINTVATTDADSVVVSCTNLRTFGIIAEVEKELGIPVVSANQATVWASLVAAGAEIPSLGQRLFP